MNWELISEINANHLTDTELRYYNDIFSYCCDNLEPDNVPVVKAIELFRSANIPRDVTMKILDICVGTKSNNHMGRKQFYAALKLVAAHQAGIDIHRDIKVNSLEIISSLPRFSWPTSGDEENRNKDNNMIGSKKIIHGSRLPDSTTESESDADESPRETGGSTDSPTPTNSVTQERVDGGETILDSTAGGWQGLLVSEEQRQLLGTEEESSERHSSDDDPDKMYFPPEEVWLISDEQREYYAAQFARLQPDPEGLLAGSVARTFFEKSRLPVSELRHIWQLADVTRDGALSLPEFYVAMHLVVLRRNHVPLVSTLPPSLQELVTASSSSTATVSPAVTAVAAAVGGAVATSSPTKASSPPPTSPLINQNSSIIKPQEVINSRKVNEKNKEWTKFVDSPTGTSGSLTSPGPKPVNFDFQKSAVERDPKILHPVPLRLTPEAAILASGANGNNGNSSLVDDDIQHSAISLVQRPISKKTIPNEDSIIVTPKKEPPPPPPPRPYRTHTRSSSLDLNKLGKNGQTFLGTPPSVPPRVSPGSNSPRKLVGQKSESESQRTVSESQGFVADFSQFSPKNDEIVAAPDIPPASTQPQQFVGACGAFHIYKKPNQGEDETGKDEDDGKKLTLEELREKNTELRQVCEELTRELASALQERINLRAKLLLIT